MRELEWSLSNDTWVYKKAAFAKVSNLAQEWTLVYEKKVWYLLMPEICCYGHVESQII